MFDHDSNTDFEHRSRLCRTGSILGSISEGWASAELLSVCVCVCVCVRERERGRGREGEGERLGERERRGREPTLLAVVWIGEHWSCTRAKSGPLADR